MTQNFQSLAGAQGAEFEARCRTLLTRIGWDLVPALPKFSSPFNKVQIDIIGRNENGAEVWFECKGSELGERPGSRRTDTVLKAIASAYLIHEASPPYVLLTSHLPDPKSVAYTWLQYAKDKGILIPICINQPEHVTWLTNWQHRLMPPNMTKQG